MISNPDGAPTAAAAAVVTPTPTPQRRRNRHRWTASGDGTGGAGAERGGGHTTGRPRLSRPTLHGFHIPEQSRARNLGRAGVDRASPNGKGRKAELKVSTSKKKNERSPQVFNRVDVVIDETHNQSAMWPTFPK